MDNEVVEGYYAQVEGARFDQTQGGFVYPCDSEMPDFGIIISESYTANIPGSLMTFNRLGRGSDREFFAPHSPLNALLVLHALLPSISRADLSSPPVRLFRFVAVERRTPGSDPRGYLLQRPVRRL